MDDTKTHNHIQQHADAVVRGDLNAIMSDFSEDLRPHVPQLAQALPQPVNEAHVLSVEVGADESVATIRYSGDTEDVTIRSRWRDIDDRPLIVHAEPVV
jgi:hypothetical protein